MSGRRSVGRYRAIDLSIFALMVFVTETLLVTAETKWFPGQAYTVSLTGALTAIVMVRWGPWAAIHAGLGGLVFCLASGAQPRQFAIYALGNELALLLVPLIRRGGEGRIAGSGFAAVLYGLGALALMQAGRALVAMILGAAPAAALGFMTTDVASLVVTAAILWIARRLDGVLENQYHYLMRVQAEREREEGGNP